MLPTRCFQFTACPRSSRQAMTNVAVAVTAPPAFAPKAGKERTKVTRANQRIRSPQPQFWGTGEEQTASASSLPLPRLGIGMAGGPPHASKAPRRSARPCTRCRCRKSGCRTAHTRSGPSWKSASFPSDHPRPAQRRSARQISGGEGSRASRPVRPAMIAADSR